MKRPAPRRSRRTFRSSCPLASALDLLGDRWSLLVVRGLFTGARRFRDFLEQPEGIATNILSDRLRQLEDVGIIASVTTEAGTHEYLLTRRGADLLPSLQALARWGHEHLEGRWTPPESFMKARPAQFYPDREKD